MPDSDKRRLSDRIDLAIQSPARLSVASLVELILETEQELIAVMTPQWQRSALRELIQERMRKLAAADSSQMAFPFHDLSIHIPVKNGSVELGKATMGQLRACERLLVERRQKPRSNSLLFKIRRQIELMTPYVLHSRRITVQQVEQLVLQGIKPTETKQDMGEIMRRYWAAKTPEERSAIARRRNRKRWQPNLPLR